MPKRRNPTLPRYQDADYRRDPVKSVDPSNPEAPNLREPPKKPAKKPVKRGI